MTVGEMTVGTVTGRCNRKCFKCDAFGYLVCRESVPGCNKTVINSLMYALVNSMQKLAVYLLSF